MVISISLGEDLMASGVHMEVWVLILGETICGAEATMDGIHGGTCTILVLEIMAILVLATAKIQRF